MTSKEYKSIFDLIAKKYGFQKAFGGWFKKSEESLAVLILQKSSYGNYYQLLVQVYIQGLFDRTYLPSKDLMKNSMGHINSGETQDFAYILDFDQYQDDSTRVEETERMFSSHIVPFVDKMSSKQNILDSVDRNELWLLPLIDKELRALK